MKMFTIHRPSAPEPADFCYAQEGEMAFPPVMVCDRSCGCERAHAGMTSNLSSTTLVVRNVELGPDALVDAGVAYLEQAGWARLVPKRRELRRLAEQMMSAMAEEAAGLEEGAVVRPFFRPDDKAAPSKGGEWVYVEAAL